MKRKNGCKILFGLFVIIGLITCNINTEFGINGSGNIVEQERNLPKFTGIEVRGGIELYITQGDTQKVVVETDDNLQKIFITKVEDDILKIYTDRWFVNSKSLKVKVVVKDLIMVSCSGGSDAFTEKPFTAGNLAINLSGGSDANLELKATEITGHISGGSDLYMKGTVVNFNLEASGGSDCKAYDLTATKANLTASGGSDVYITVNDELKAVASGGSDIKYRGTAKIVDANSSGGSDIYRE